MVSFFLKPRICSEDMGAYELSLYKAERILLVCDRFLLAHPVVLKLKASLQSSNTLALFDDIEPDPPMENIIRLVKQVQSFQPTVLIAIGGGSAIDTAKAAYYFAVQTCNYPQINLVAIPSTSGSGSEVTSVAVVTDSETNSKLPIIDSVMLPSLVVLIPELVQSCPPSITAYSGLDVLTHSLEALVAKESNTFTDTLATKAVQLVFSNLEKAYHNGDEFSYRKEMQIASCMAGIAFQNAGLGLVHALSHQIGGHFHLPHGLINGILLPKVVRFNAELPAAKEKYAQLARDLGWIKKNSASTTGVLELEKHIYSLVKALDCPNQLRLAGVEVGEMGTVLNEIIIKAQEDPTFTGNPRASSPQDLINILLTSL